MEKVFLLINNKGYQKTKSKNDQRANLIHMVGGVSKKLRGRRRVIIISPTFVTYAFCLFTAFYISHPVTGRKAHPILKYRRGRRKIQTRFKFSITLFRLIIILNQVLFTQLFHRCCSSIGQLFAPIICQVVSLHVSFFPYDIKIIERMDS